MNREQAKKLLPIIQAWVNGKVIQYRHRSENQDWHDSNDQAVGYSESIQFQWTTYEFRIKPETIEKWVICYKGGGISGGFDSKDAAICYAHRHGKDEYNLAAITSVRYTVGEGL